MARPLPILSTLPVHIFSHTLLMVFSFLAVMSILSLVTFLCASHKRQKEGTFCKRKMLVFTKENLLSSFSKANNIGSKALLKMISWRKQVHDDDDDNSTDYADHDHYIIDDDGDYEEGDAVWRKTIMMGGKCRPLDFSGKIEYDSEGNLILPRKSNVDQIRD